MAAVELLLPWSSQPQSIVEPFSSQTLKALVLGSGPSNLVDGKFPSTSGSSPTYASGVYGIARSFLRASASADIYSIFPWTGDMTMFLVVSGTSGLASQQVICGVFDASGTLRAWLGENSNNAITFVTQPIGGGSVACSSGIITPGVYVGRLQGTTQQVWRNGELVSATQATQITNNWSDVTSWRNGHTGALENSTAQVFEAGVDSRAWSDQEIVEFSTNPWSVIAPYRMPVKARRPVKYKVNNLSLPWETSPTEITEVKESSGVAFAFSADIGLLDLVNNKLSQTGNIVPYAGKQYLSNTFAVNSPQYQYADNRSAFTIAGESIRSNSYSAASWNLSLGNSYGWRLIFYDYGASTIRIDFQGSWSSTVVFSAYGYSWPGNKPVRWAICIDIPNLAYVLFAEGQEITSGSLTAAPDPIRDSGTVQLVSNTGTGNAVSRAFILPGIDTIRAKSLSQNLDQLFKPRQIPYSNAPITTRREVTYLPIERNEQPQEPVETINQAIFGPAILGSTSVIGSGPVTYINTLVKSHGIGGIGLRGTGSEMLRIPLNDRAVGANVQKLGLLVAFRTTSTVASSFIAGYGSDVGSAGANLFCIISGTDPSMLATYVGGVSAYMNSGNIANTAPINDGKLHVVLLQARVFDPTVPCYFDVFLDGRKVVNNLYANVMGNLQFQWLCSNGVRRTTDLMSAGRSDDVLYVQSIFDSLSDSEAISLTRNPWQLLNMSSSIPYDQLALTRMLEPLTPADGKSPPVILY